VNCEIWRSGLKLFFCEARILNINRMKPILLSYEECCKVSRRIKDQLDVTYYFILLLGDSTRFARWYALLQEFTTMLLNYHIGRFVLDLMCVGVRVRFD
jgi:hypothetical protein